MTQNSKLELLQEIKARYLKAGLENKIKILDEFCKNTGYNRKYAIRILQARHHYKPRVGSRPKKYLGSTLQIIIKIWELLEYPCGARLKPMLLPMAETLT